MDLHCQSLWVTYFARQLRHGDIYPRWLMDMFAGDGSPVFFYYPPLAYFITAPLVMISPSSAFNYAPISASMLLAVLLSGMTFYIWMKEETGDEDKALLGSLIYMCAPNHVAQNFYDLLLLSSVWAYAWIPLLMLFARRLALGLSYGVPGFAGCLALLVLTNIPMTLIFGITSVGYSLLYFPWARPGAAALRLAASTLLGFALAAFYLLPMLLYMDFANIRYHWANSGPQSIALGREFFLGFSSDTEIFNSLYLFVSVLLSVIYLKACPPDKRRWFYGVLLAAAFFLMLPASQLFWLYLPGLKLLQMPERLFTLTTLCFSVLMPRALPRFRRLSLLMLAASVLCAFGIALDTRITEASFQKQEPLRYDYYTLGIDQYPYYLTSPDLMERYDRKGVERLKEGHAPFDTLSGDAMLSTLHWRPRDIAFHYRASKPSTVRMRQFDFPGFGAAAGGRALELSRDDDTGEVLLKLPPGESDVEVALSALLPETAGKTISLFALMILLLILLLAYRKKITVSAMP